MPQRILICDDAIFMRTMIADILTGAGYEVAGEAESGLQRSEQKRERATKAVLEARMAVIEAMMAKKARKRCSRRRSAIRRRRR